MDSIASLLKLPPKSVSKRGITNRYQALAFELMESIGDDPKYKGMWLMLSKRYPEAALREWVATAKGKPNPRKYFMGILRNVNK